MQSKKFDKFVNLLNKIAAKVNNQKYIIGIKNKIKFSKF